MDWNGRESSSKALEMASVLAFLQGVSSSTPVTIQIESIPEQHEVPIDFVSQQQDVVVAVSSKNVVHHQCVICGKETSNASNLNRHMRTIHKTEPLKAPSKHPKCLCPLCDQSCLQRSSLIKHLKDVHDIHCASEEHLFQDWQSKLLTMAMNLTIMLCCII